MTRARSLSKLSNPATFTVDTDNNVGVNSTSPVEKLNIVGVVSATSFFGDGTGLTGVASTDNIITGTAATFNSVVKVGTGITLDATSGIVTATGVNVTGVVTATTFLGNVTGNVTGNATGLSGSPSITVTNINAADITASGTLTYEDVTNVDSVGVVTARGGFEIGASGVGGTITAVGNAEIAGIMTATEFHGSGANLTNLPASGDSNDITASLFI
jgi:hypothetical protein